MDGGENENGVKKMEKTTHTHKDLSWLSLNIIGVTRPKCIVYMLTYHCMVDQMNSFKCIYSKLKCSKPGA